MHAVVRVVSATSSVGRSLFFIAEEEEVENKGLAMCGQMVAMMGRNVSVGVCVASVGREEARRVRRRRRRGGEGLVRWWVVWRVMVRIREWVFERGGGSSEVLVTGGGVVAASGCGCGSGSVGKGRSASRGLEFVDCKRVMRSAMVVGL